VSYEQLPLKRMATVTLGKMIQTAPSGSLDSEAPYLRAAHVQPNGRLIEAEEKRMWFRSGELEELSLEGDDVVIVEGGAGYGRSAVLSQARSGWGFQNSIVRVRPQHNRASGRFINYAVQSALRSGAIAAACNTATIPHFTADKVADLPLPSPTFDVQQAIADYLDRETAQIDTLIAKQEQLIATLRERRIGTIREAVTKGIDPRARMIDSQVDWIGMVPQHWRCDRLRWSVSDSQTGVWGDDPRGDETDVICVRVADFDRRRLRVGSTHTRRSVRPQDLAPRLLESKDLLLEKSGGTPINPVGFVVIFNGSATPAVSSNFIARLRVAERQDPRYWLYAHAASYATGLTARSVNQTTGIQNLDQSAYFSEIFPFPPAEEQRAIAEFLDIRCNRIDTLLYKATALISLAKERRAALITAAVTGQIDVRAAA